ncbi:Uncharacterised protein [Mycobacteroides abscessus]|nr:Uncharacterised protein [Mycobacteroides abscessus]
MPRSLFTNAITRFSRRAAGFVDEPPDDDATEGAEAAVGSDIGTTLVGR